MSKAATIDEVIERLGAIVDRSRNAGSRLGYFAALYRRVTIEVKKGIGEGFFDDGPRMERLDVIFANRYLAAFDAHHEGGTLSRSWADAFQVADQWWPIVLQHLLLGMNAHINLDLGIAAADTVEPSGIDDLHDDFMKINDVLSRMAEVVKEDLANIWATLGIFNKHLGSVESTIINFSMAKARDAAWSVAQRMAPLSGAEREAAVRELDADVAELGRVIRHPGVVGSTVTKIVRLGETGFVATKIGHLA